jgi:hypothetical protein
VCSSDLFDCSGLASITIPSSVTDIGREAFSGCSGLETITVESGNTEYYSGGNCLIEKNSKVLILGCRNSVIPNDVMGIESQAFYNCSGLASVTIPSSVTYIGWNAFYGCTGLTSITIPNSVTSIGSDAFSGCYIETADINSQAALDAISFNSIVNITLGNNVTKIESNKFRECPNLMSVTINEGVTSIGRSAFYRCSGLTSVTIPNSVTSIGDNAFYKCTGLKEVINKSALNITKGSTNNGYVAYYADYVCNGGKTVIGDFIFSDQDKILVKYTGDGGDITLPEDFNGEEYTVGANMFDGSTGLTSIIVPCDRYDYFKGAITRYSSIVYGNCTFEVKTNVNNENYGTVTESGIFKKGQTLQITATPSEHYHFVKWNDNNTQNPRTVQVTRDSTFTAVFAIDEHYVFINKNISDAGTVTGNGVYEYNTTVQLTATAN